MLHLPFGEARQPEAFEWDGGLRFTDHAAEQLSEQDAELEAVS